METRPEYKSAPADPRHYQLEEAVGHILRRVHQRATAIFQAEIGDPHLTPTQFATLVKLRDEGELSQNHLGRLTAMDPATIQGVIQRLRARGLVASRSDPKDKRRTLLQLSASGEALTASLVERGHQVSAEILAPLSTKEQTSLLALLKRLT